MKRLLVLVALLVTPSALADSAGYAYSTPVTTSSTTLAMTAGTVTAGAHAAVWLGVSDITGKMTLQAGVLLRQNVLEQDGLLLTQDDLCVYVERIDQTGRSFRCLRPIAFGDHVQVRVTFSKRHGTVIWVDGKSVGSATFPVQRIATDGLGHSKPYAFAVSETYGPATITPSIQT
jgi:hypothetical protein